MEVLFEGFSEDITKWEVIRNLEDLDLIQDEKRVEEKSDANVRLLPRRKSLVYGIIPKMEQRVYSECMGCNQIFHPRHVLLHKNCSGRGGGPPISLRKKVKSTNKKLQTSSSNRQVPNESSSKSEHRSKEWKQSASSGSNSSSRDLHEKPSSSKELNPHPNVRKKVKSKNKKSHSSPPPPPPLFKVPLPPPPSPPVTVSTSPEVQTSESIASSTSPVEIPITTKLPSHADLDVVASSPESIPRTSTAETPSCSAEADVPMATASEAQTPTASVTSPISSSSGSSSRYSSKTRKGSKVPKEYDPDVHCGVVEGNKGPCTRSITCTNHRIQLKKLVSGRSKDIHQLIAERKVAKEKDSLKLTNSSYMPLTGAQTKEKEIFCQSTTCAPIVATIVNTVNTSPSVAATSFLPIMPKVNIENVPGITTATTTTVSRQKTTSVTSTNVAKITPTEQVIIDTSKAVENWYSPQSNSQDSAIGTVPVVYMPMSPISVVSPVQFVQIGKNMICLESPQSAMSPPLPNQSVFLTIPDQQSSVKMYKSHPKPIAMPSFGTRKVGGAILLTNHTLDRQRNDLIKAINMRRKTNNLTQEYKTVSLLNNAPHRPNILKVKSLNKVNCKRPANEKNNTSDSKQLRLTPDVNGFILHADMSESADAPQPNNCIQEKIALLNMK